MTFFFYAAAHACIEGGSDKIAKLDGAAPVLHLG
jgi:hypothetical protein